VVTVAVVAVVVVAVAVVRVQGNQWKLPEVSVFETILVEMVATVVTMTEQSPTAVLGVKEFIMLLPAVVDACEHV